MMANTLPNKAIPVISISNILLNKEKPCEVVERCVPMMAMPLQKKSYSYQRHENTLPYFPNFFVVFPLTTRLSQVLSL